MTELGYLMVDADQHYYETDDCFTRHIDPAFRQRTIELVSVDGRPAQPFVAGVPCGFYKASPCAAIARPGAMLEYFKSGGGTGEVLGFGGIISAEDLPESRHRDVRVRHLDEHGVEATVMLPSLAVGVEYELSVNDPEALGPNLTSFNRWLHDDWGYGADGRIFGVPLLSLHDLDWALSELDRVIALGARIVHLRPGPVANRYSPADPRFDPFWARCAEAGVAVAFHIGDSGLCETYTAMWSERPRPPLHRYSPFQRVTAFGERAIHDTLAALTTHNLFGRFPTLTVLSIENGSEWVRPLLKKLDRAAKTCGPRDWPFGDPGERPREIFKRHIKVAPYPEDDSIDLVRLIGADAVIAGSDYPHPEGLPEPTEFAERLLQLDAAESRLIMRDTTAALLGLR